MTHLFVCREYPPAAYPPGGIGTYVRHITRLLAAAGDTVHVIAHRWDGAPDARQTTMDGRLIVHRVALDEAVPADWTTASAPGPHQVPLGLLASSYPSQAFAWQAAILAERLIAHEGIDLVEGQEWEAPLYYLQLRRALGLGPTRRPPCVVHLHSPSELIFEANGWDTSVADHQPAAALERYSITTADTVLCPSRYLAEQCIARYRLDRSRVHVIPYPLGEFPHIDRASDVWASGAITHVGRLEPRKGVIEWAGAIALAAGGHPQQTFAFLGSDTPVNVAGGRLVGEAARAELPRPMRKQLRFHGSQNRDGMVAVLAQSWATVVASRWENFPYSCMEAMCSGLPVIVSPQGGMRELVEDGVSGWVASDGTPSGLAGALRRALDTPPAMREQMGRAAEATVRRVCDNDAIVRQHQTLKSRLVRETASVTQTSRPAQDGVGGLGLAIVVSTPDGTRPTDECLASLRIQQEAAAAICIVSDQAGPRHATIVATAKRLIDEQPALAGVVFVDGRASLEPDLLRICHDALTRDDGIGVFSTWTRQTAPADAVRVQPSPDAPHRWNGDSPSPFVAVRTSALAQVEADGSGADAARALLALCDAVLARGWAGLTYPAVKVTIAFDASDPAGRPAAVRFSCVAQAVQRLHVPLLQWLRTCAPEDRRAFVRQGARHPGRSARMLADMAMRGWRARTRVSP